LSRNSKRTNAGLEPTRPDVADPAIQNASHNLTFSAPTEHVDLPSRGRYYSEGHPLHNKDTIEIKYMTAKEEDILTSRNLLKKGLAIERLLSSIIIDKTIDPGSLLIGDRNALIVAARITGFGEEYETKVQCPACAANVDHTFDLTNVSVNYAEEVPEEVQATDGNTFIVSLPIMKIDIELKLLEGHDERRIIQLQENKRKKKLPETPLTDQLSAIIQSVNGSGDRSSINSLVNMMPAKDTRYLRRLYDRVIPNVDMSHNFECTECGYLTDLEVPFTTDFFWPKR